MTWLQFAETYYSERGVPESDVKSVVDLAMRSALLASLRGHWGNDIDAYPVSMKESLIVLLDEAALDWVKRNRPDELRQALA